MKLIEPSLLSIDKANAQKQLKIIKDMRIPHVHYDVMDPAFCGHSAYKTELLKDIEAAGLKANVHLMVKHPKHWLGLYAQYNLNSLGFHAETQSIFKSKLLLKKIRKMGFKSMFSVKIETDLNTYKQLLPYTDIILIMSVEPGLGGQRFDPLCKKNLLTANEFKKQFPNLIIQIDGGMNETTIPQVKQYVDWIVTGNWFFKNIDHIDQCLKDLKL